MFLLLLSLGTCQDTVNTLCVPNFAFPNCHDCVSKKWILFQCTHKVPSSQLTVHIITHHQKIRNHLDVYEHLEGWVPGHLYWIQHVSREFLYEQGLKVEEYANNIISPHVPIDELGLLVIAHMYHTHFGVILNDRLWYTTDDNSGKYSKFHLLYQGGVYFSDTCTGNWNMPSPPAVVYVLDEHEQENAGNLKVSPEIVETPNSTSKQKQESDQEKDCESDRKEDSKEQPEKVDSDVKMDSKDEQKIDSESDRKEDSNKETEKVDSEVKDNVKTDSQDEQKMDCDSDPKEDLKEKPEKVDSDVKMDSKDGQKMDSESDGKEDSKEKLKKVDSQVKDDVKMDSADDQDEDSEGKIDQEMDFSDHEKDSNKKQKVDSVKHSKDWKMECQKKKLQETEHNYMMLTLKSFCLKQMQQVVACDYNIQKSWELSC